MDMEFRDEKSKEIERKRISHFCERYGSILCKKSPEEIIQMWCDFEFARFQVIENSNGFYINDMDNKTIVAFISKEDPRAFVHAYELCEKMNDPPKAPSISIDGREIMVSETEVLVELKDNSLVDFLISNIENEKDEL